MNFQLIITNLIRLMWILFVQPNRSEPQSFIYNVDIQILNQHFFAFTVFWTFLPHYQHTADITVFIMSPYIK